MPPKITPSPDGPYLFEGKAYCRCGGSKTKPFCDGTHKTNGFSGENLANPAKDRRRSYAGKKVTIFDNRSVCSHATHCTELEGVFRKDGRPWVVPDGADVEAIIATIRRCPSGALSYAIDGVEAKDPVRPPALTVRDHGPYEVTGGIELEGAKFGEGVSGEHYALCRCGASKNKPFCDGSHWDINF